MKITPTRYTGVGTVPYWSLSSEDRTIEARQLIGHVVTIVIDPSRTREAQGYAAVGTLVSAARLDHGTTKDVVVVRYAGQRDQAYSGAIIRSIKSLGVLGESR